jgi:hypothetical protein
VTPAFIHVHNSESTTGRDLKPGPISSDSDTGLVDTVMESIDRSLRSIEESVLGLEAVATRLRPSRETRIDLEFVLHNMLYDVAEPSPLPELGQDRRHRLVTDHASGSPLDRLAISA